MQPQLAPNTTMITAESRDRWRVLIEQRCGAWHPESRWAALECGITERMRALGIEGAEDYLELAESGRCGAFEWDELLDLVVSRQTSFFRHAASFECLSSTVIPQLARVRGRNHTISMWSAGCSTGEEAYSMAMTALESASLSGREVKVCGSDLNSGSLAYAARGRYRERDVQHIPGECRRRFFAPVNGSTGRGAWYEAMPVLRRRVRFTAMNLIEPRAYTDAMFDLIFCQNVVIDFREHLRVDVIARLATHLNPGGFLLLGPGENAGVRLNECEPVEFGEACAYRRSA